MSTSSNPRLKLFLLIGSLCKDGKMRTDNHSITMCGFEILNGVLYSWDQFLNDGGIHKYSHMKFVAGKNHTGFNSPIDDHI